MKPNFTLTSLYTLGLITVSLSEFVIKEVQHGGEASLLCSNLSTSIINISWFKMDKRANTKPRSSNSHIASMCTADSNATVQEEFKNGRFQMSTNTTHVFLNITKVDLSDSGMYFCGFYKKKYYVIFDATLLEVKELSSKISHQLRIIQGSVLTLFTIILFIIVFIKIRKTQ